MERSDRNWTTAWWWHPWVLAAYPPMHLYAYNVRQALLGDLATILAVSLGVAGIVWVALWVARVGAARRALIAAVLVALFFSYPVFDWFRGRFFAAGFSITPLETVLAVAVAGVAGVYVLSRLLQRDRTIDAANRFLNVASLALIVVGAAAFGFDQVRAGAAAEAPPATRHQPIEAESKERPSIVVLLLDAYGGADVLEELYGVDNAPFMNALTELGFSVSDSFHANYPYTEFSVASLLNMRYELHPENRDIYKPFQLDAAEARMRSASDALRDSFVARELRRLGYRHITYETGFSAVEIPNSDEYLRPRGTISDLEGAFINRTWLAPILRNIGVSFRRFVFAEDHRRRLEFTFDQLSGLRTGGTPQFVWAHILFPHQPFVYDAAGRPVTPPRTMPEIRRAYDSMYAEQIQYANTVVLETAGDLVRNNDDAVIVLLGDHGPRSEAEHERSWEAHARDFASTVYAVRFPNGTQPERSDEVRSHVNVFRALFGDLFGADLGMLPDVSFIPRDRTSSEYLPVVWAAGEPRSAIEPGKLEPAQASAERE